MPSRRAPHILWVCLSLAGGGALLSGCGQKGDLYLPEKPAKTSAEDTVQAPPRDQDQDQE